MRCSSSLQAAQHLYRHHLAGAGIVSPKDPAETPGGDLVQQTVTAEDEAVHVPLEDLVPLPGGEVALALQDAQEQRQVRVAAARLIVGVLQSLPSLGLRDQPELEGQERERHCVQIVHDSRVPQGSWCVESAGALSNSHFIQYYIPAKRKRADRSGWEGVRDATTGRLDSSATGGCTVCQANTGARFAARRR
jgi:hypothetical protein